MRNLQFLAVFNFFLLGFLLSYFRCKQKKKKNIDNKAVRFKLGFNKLTHIKMGVTGQMTQF